MANILRSLIVDLRTRSAKFEQGMGRSARQLRTFNRTVQTGSRHLASFTVALTGAAGAAGLLTLTKRAIDAGDQIQKLSIRLGASTEALSQYQFVAERSGVAFNTFTTGLQRMVRRVAEAAEGTGEARGALAELGLVATDLRNLAPEDQFESIADAMAGVTNQGDRVRLAMKLFDTEGVALLQTMEGGSEAIRDLRAEADRLGLTLDRAAVDKMAEAKDATASLEAAFRGLGNMLATDFAQDLAEFTRGLADGISMLRRMIGDLNHVGRLSRDQQVDDMTRRIVEVRRELDAGRASGATGPRAIARIAELEASLASLIEARSRLLAAEHRPGAGGGSIQITGGAPGGASEGQERALFASMISVDRLQTERELMAERETMARQHFAAMIEEHKRAVAEQERIEKEKADLMRSVNQSLWLDVAGFLQVFAGESKAAAVLTIAINKGLSIAQAVQNTAVAYTKALTLDPTGGLAARVAALGKIQIGIIAATGFAQAARVGSGGASLGSAANPVNTQSDTGGSDARAAAQGRGTFTFNNYGTIAGTAQDVQEWFAEVYDQARNRDLLVTSV